MRHCRPAAPSRHQRGAAAVEFALIALFAFLPLLMALIELSRLFYLANTVQEVTRRAARAQTVQWISASPGVQRAAFFSGAASGTASLPGSPDLKSSQLRLSFHASWADAVAGKNAITLGSPAANAENCLLLSGDCVRYVRASLETAPGQPLPYADSTGWFPQLDGLRLPAATVIMPAEALGLQ